MQKPQTPESAPIVKKRISDPLPVQIVLIGVTLLFFTGFIFLPLGLVFAQAFSKGWEYYLESIREPYALEAVKLTLTTVAIVVPLNAFFGVTAAWAITKFNFKGKATLKTLLDLPFAVSPVIAGLIFVLLVGSRTPFGSWLGEQGIKIIFSTPGIVIATLFVTFPFVARELIPLMEAQGRDEEEAALTLGARGWQIFGKITLPNIRWGLLYGMILCSARSIGEFGAVSVVSGHIRGQTNTIPLHVEILYSEYNFAASFAVASILVFLALLTVGVKVTLEKQFQKNSFHHQELPCALNFRTLPKNLPATRRSTTSTLTSLQGSLLRCLGHRAAAKLPCCASLRVWNCPIQEKLYWNKRTPPTCRPEKKMLALCFSTMRFSAV